MDYESLREDLKNYFGTAIYCGNPMAIIELSKVENASCDELILIAIEKGFDIENYKFKRM